VEDCRSRASSAADSLPGLQRNRNLKAGNIKLKARKKLETYKCDLCRPQIMNKSALVSYKSVSATEKWK